MKAGSLLVVAALCFGLQQRLQAQDAGVPAMQPVWAPPEPAEDGFDWIQLKSGEWLKGRLAALQDEKLEFDSEELDDLEFKWEDVFQLRSPHIQDLLFQNKDEASGPISVTREWVTVGGASPRTFPRAKLLSITRGGSREGNYWSGDVTLGLTLRTGNADEVLYNAAAGLQRRTPATRFDLDYLGAVSRTDDVESSNNHRVNAEFDLWLSKRLYLVLPSGEYFTDAFQNIDQRITLGAGLGYDLLDRSALEWNVTAKPSYQFTRFDSVQAGDSESKNAGAIVLGSEFDWEVSKRVDLVLEYQGQFTKAEVGGTLHHLVSTLEIELTRLFDLDISFIWDRVGNPEADENGFTPEPDDFRLVVGIGVDF